MKTIFNILFEKLHRYVFDYYLQSTNPDWGLPTKYDKANRNNKLEPLNHKIYYLYRFLCPFFEGWRISLAIWLPFVRKYRRYSYYKSVLMQYELDQVNKLSRLVYKLKTKQ